MSFNIVSMSSSSLWQRFQQYFLYYRDPAFSVDISRMKFPDDFFEKMRPKIDNAFAAMRALEAGAIANPTEKRMVGHYWLRNPTLAPTPEIRTEIEETVKRIKTFAADIRGGKITAENGKSFKHVLLIGIGGSALGPQFVSDALGSRHDPMDILFFDNTDPDGFDRVFEKMSDELGQTLVVVVSKSGGTKETRNGMLEAEVKFKEKGLQFNKHAVAVTGVGRDLEGKIVHQGIAVYGNKGSTDQHAYVQQLRDGVLNFFVTFIEVDKDRRSPPIEIEDEVTSGDYLHGFLRGTRSALYESGRESITLSIPRVDPFNIGVLIALYERAVGFYASLVDINAYDQPGVEAGKKAATKLLQLQKQVREKLAAGSGKTAEEIARSIDADPEDVFHVLRHLASNDPHVRVTSGQETVDDRFSLG